MKKISFLMSAVIFLSGCTLFSKPEVKSPQNPDHFKVKVKQAANSKRMDWWKNFKDEKLNQLVAQALRNNVGYLIALKNIQVAETYVTQNAANLFPQVNVNYASTRERISVNSLNFSNPGQVLSNRIYNLHQLNGSLTYELDVWHQVANTVNQAKAEVSASEATSRVVQQTLVGDVVTTYFQIKTVNQTLANLKRQYQAANEIVRLTNNQYKGGLIDIGPLEDAKAQLESVKINIHNAQEQKQISQNTLAYLMGEYPEKFNCNAGNVFSPPRYQTLIPQELPSYVLAKRPDIQNAYYEVFSYGYLEKESIANFLPQISLTGLYGFASMQLRNLTTGGSLLWNYGAAVVQPLLDFGQRMSQYSRAKYQYEISVMNYKNTVINAFKEVDSALASYQEDYQSLKATARDVTYSKEKLLSATAQYKGGVIDYPTYLTYQLTYLQTENTHSNQNLAVLQDVVQAYKAFGIGL